jgi:hypothetical protein
MKLKHCFVVKLLKDRTRWKPESGDKEGVETFHNDFLTLFQFLPDTCVNTADI